MEVKMKRLLLALTAILLICSFLLTACTPSTPTASSTSTGTKTYAPGTYKFKYSNFFPPTSQYSMLAEMWIKEINKRTNGAVEISYFPGGALTAADKIYDGVVTGISDIGFSVVAYNMGRFPATELIDMPQGYPNGYVATMVANDFYNNFKPAEFKDVHMFYFQATGPQVIFTAKTPVNKLEDLQGLVLRSTGVGSKIATALGAAGYAAAQNQAADLISKNVIQGSIAPREVLLGWKQADFISYVTECYDIGSVSNMYVIMNNEKWNSLPADIQKVFTDVSAQWIEYHAKVSANYDKLGMDYFFTQPGRKEINLTPEESARWVAKVQPLLNESLASVSSKGLDSKAFQQYIQDRIKYWTPKTPKAEDMTTWVAANVKLP
jgi:TRAP-type C4-dicarboxylate transport system substrate-binding protein